MTYTFDAPAVGVFEVPHECRRRASSQGGLSDSADGQALFLHLPSVLPMPTYTYQGQSVAYYQRADGRWALSFRELGKSRRTHTTCRGDLKACKKRCLEICRRLALGALVAVDAEIGDRLDDIRRQVPGRSLSAVLDDLLLALETLPDGVGLRQAAELAARPEEQPTPFREAMRRFLGEYDKRNRLTAAALRGELRAFEKENPGAMVGDLDADALKSWAGRGQPEAVTFNNRLRVWSNFMNRCREWGYLNPDRRHAAELVRRRKEARKSPEILSIGQAREFLSLTRAHDDETFLPALALGSWAGLRPYEVGRLDWGNVDLEAGYIHVGAEVSAKLQHERFVPIRHNLASILPEGRRGRVVADLTARRMSEAARAAGILDKWPVDVLRHSFCSYRLAECQSAGAVAEEAGNSESVIRSRYRRPVKREEGKAWFRIE